MKHLLVDVGNTSAKYCLLTDSCYQLITSFDALQVIDSIDALVIASVSDNPEVDQLRDKALASNISVQNVEVMPESFGITCGYPNYQNLGIDRWLAVIAAELLYPQENLVIVDAGTAMTVDFLTANKKHLGGWIIPGIDLMQEAIVNKAPNVFKTDQCVQETFATDTPSAVFNGCVVACESTIYSAVELFSQKVGSNIRVLLTGGNAGLLLNRLKIESVEQQNLIFIGLNRFVNA